MDCPTCQQLPATFSQVEQAGRQTRRELYELCNGCERGITAKESFATDARKKNWFDKQLAQYVRAVEGRVLSGDDKHKLFPNLVVDEPPFKLLSVLPFALPRMSCNEMLAHFGE